MIVELPPWVMAAYPSSLLYHFNIDICSKPFSSLRLAWPDGRGLSGFKFVSAPEGETPRPDNTLPLGVGGEEGRGSWVYFNEASMHQSSETGYSSLKEARLRGHSGKTDYSSDIQRCFEQHGKFIEVPEALRQKH